jgi:hypothetical protein
MTEHYKLESEIEAVVRGFETCTTDKLNFKHKDHLTVAVVYLQELSVAEAVERMREALLAFLDHHGVPREKYNEAVTVFWIEQVALRLAELPPGTGLVEQCNYVIDATKSISTTDKESG